MTTNTLLFYKPSWPDKRVRKASINQENKRKFSTTSRRYAMESGPLILAKYGTMSPALTIAMVFITYGISMGGYLVTRLSTSAVEAQHIEMFPEDLEDDFFFVPDRVMTRMFRYIGAMREAVKFWNNLEHLVCLSQAEAKELLYRVLNLQELLENIRLQCTYISDLSSPQINGDIEHIISDMHEMDVILRGIDSIITILTTII